MMRFVCSTSALEHAADPLTLTVTPDPHHPGLKLSPQQPM